MQFRIADTFTSSLAKLTRDEQKAAKTTAFDLQINPQTPGLSLHRIDRSKDHHFWSVRVNQELRLIIHRIPSSMMLVYVGHHDDAYRWAQRRRIEQHPKTGAAQIVEIRETVRDVEDRRYTYKQLIPDTRPLFFEGISDAVLLGYGVPETWLGDVRGANEDTLLDIAGHLPSEAAEALLVLATGETPEPPIQTTTSSDPFDHPDAQRRFRLVDNKDELERALEYPWEKWTVFLHPSQRRIVEGDFNGPARVSGSAGTGKTIVALHRAVHLARHHPDARILLATFSMTLANTLGVKLGYLVQNQPRIAERLEVNSISRVGRRLYETNFGPLCLASEEITREVINQIAGRTQGHKFSSNFLWAEWNQVVDAWQLQCWEEYRDVKRLGRKVRLAETQRKILWSIFTEVRRILNERRLLSESDMFHHLEHYYVHKAHSPYDFYVIDEAQDIGVAELRFLSSVGCQRPDSLFFAGDLGQRIFRTPFSWRTLGVDIRGRSHNLRVNYRTSHQIRRHADHLLPQQLTDVDGITEERAGTVSAFNGPEPNIMILESTEEETKVVADWLTKRHNNGIKPQEIAIFVRSQAEIPRALESIQLAGLCGQTLDEVASKVLNKVTIGTIHRAKGLEFRAVAVIACDDDVLPLQSRIENITDPGELEDTYTTERHLLYVACTRARDYLMVSGVKPASEFLDDLQSAK